MTFLLALLLAQPAPARDLVSSVPTGELVLSAPRTGVTLKVSEQNITGPNLQLGRYGNELRGSFGNRPADIHWTADRVSGQIGPGAPLNLHVQPSPEGLRVEGLMQGIHTHYTLGYGVLDGRIGRCEYHLRADGAAYQGERTCDFGVTEPVTLRIPRSLAERPPAELVAVLTATFLGQQGRF